MEVVAQPTQGWRPRRVALALVASTMMLMFAQARASARTVVEPEFSDPFAMIGHGIVGGQHWDALVYRHNRRPCVDLSLGTEGFVLCERPGPVVLPVISNGHGKKEVTIFAVLARSSVAKLYLHLVGRQDETLTLKAVGTAKSRQSHIPAAMQYGVRVIHGRFCLKRFVVLNHGDHRIFTSFSHPCD